jgi:hypothetical protein
VGRGVGLKKGNPAMWRRQYHYFAVHAAGHEDVPGRAREIQPRESPAYKGINEDGLSTSKAIANRDSSNELPQNGQFPDTVTGLSSLDVPAGSKALSYQETQKYLPLMDSIAPSSKDRVNQEPKLAKGDHIAYQDEDRKEKYEIETYTTPVEITSSSNAEIFNKKITNKADAAKKNVGISSKTPIQQESYISQSTNQPDRSDVLTAPETRRHHFLQPREFTSDQQASPSSQKTDELDPIVEIDVQERIQTILPRFDVISEIQETKNAFSNGFNKNHSVIKPALTSSPNVSEYKRRTIEPKEPDQVNVSIGSIEIKAESPPAILPSEPVASYGFSEYEPMRRYLSWERG